MSTRRTICAIHNLHSKVSKEKKGKVVDARCRDLTNAAVVTKASEEPGSVEVCDFHEVGNFFSRGTVLSLKDVLEELEWRYERDNFVRGRLDFGRYLAARTRHHNLPVFHNTTFGLLAPFIFHNEGLIRRGRCHLSTSSFTPSITF
jgi:hypothetical protein